MAEVKGCPSCKRVYTDASLRYCLEDGMILSSRFYEEADSVEEQDTVITSNSKSNKSTLDVSLSSHELNFYSNPLNNLLVHFKRTLRVPDDGNVYPLPADLGRFPIYKVSDYLDRVPESWQHHRGVFIPLYQSEALWINFPGIYCKPKAVKVAVGKINAITGQPWTQQLTETQDYMVCPPQRWVDGVKTSSGIVRQFVAMPLGMGYTVEGQLTGKEEFGGIQIVVFEPKEGMFPDKKPKDKSEGHTEFSSTLKSVARGYEMGVAPGGKIQQKIYPDTHGYKTWDENKFGRVYVHLVNSLMFREITGLEPPPTPITSKTYQENNLPWFEVYDDELKDVRASDKLYTVKSIAVVDEMKGHSTAKDSPIKIPKSEIIQLKLNKVEDGDW